MKKNKKLANYLCNCIFAVLVIIAIIILDCIYNLFGINLSLGSKFLIFLITFLFIKGKKSDNEVDVFDEENDSVNSNTGEKKSKEAIKNSKRKKTCNTMLDEYYLYQKSTNTQYEDLKDEQEEIEKKLSNLSKQLVISLLLLVIFLAFVGSMQIIY